MKKFLICLLALIVAEVIFFTCAIGSSIDGKWFRNSNVSTWFGRGSENDNTNNGDNDNTNKGDEDQNNDGDNTETPPSEDNESPLIITPEEITFSSMSLEVMPKALNDEEENNNSVEAVNGTCTITAVYKPISAKNTAVDWSVVYYSTGEPVDPETSAIIVTPIEDGALTAEVRCIKAFSSRLKIICTLRSNKEITASCRVDYRTKYTGTAFSFITHGNEDNLKTTGIDDEKSIFDLSLDHADAHFLHKGIIPNITQGTIDTNIANYIKYNVYVRCYSGFYGYYNNTYAGEKKVNLSNEWQLACRGTYSSVDSRIEFNTREPLYGDKYYQFLSLLCPDINATSDGYDEDSYYYFWSAYYGYCSFKSHQVYYPDSTPAMFEIKVEAQISSNDKDYSEPYVTVEQVHITSTSPKAPAVDDLEIGKDIIF